jgi:hypothetical protein
LSHTATADLGPGGPRKPPPQPQITITVVEKADSAKLMVPHNLVGGGVPAPRSAAPLPTIIAGVALAGAVLLGGLRLVRSRGGRKLVIALAVGVMGHPFRVPVDT